MNTPTATHPYLITPLAPLVVRGGKPFGAGSRDGDNAPLPSAMAGALRAQLIDSQGWSDQTAKDACIQSALQCISVGPLYLHEDAQGQLTPWVPCPADALYLTPEQPAHPVTVHRLAPGGWPSACGADLPPGLLPLMGANLPKSKPVAGPRWWPLSQLRQWRSQQAATMPCATVPDEPALDLRTHVAINPATLAAADGKLFQIEGRDHGPFLHRAAKGQPAQAAGRWHLFARLGGDKTLPPSALTLGGERRLSQLSPASAATAELFAPTKTESQALGELKTGQWLALSLITPAVFAQGWRPGWLDKTLQGSPPQTPGLRLQLRAAAVPRWQGISGWDLPKNKPKASRRAVAAGAVYWFEVLNTEPADASALWLAPLSDHPQDRLDGWGAALPHVALPPAANPSTD
jgi:CRISPR-associated protein Cmr3